MVVALLFSRNLNWQPERADLHSNEGVKLAVVAVVRWPREVAIAAKTLSLFALVAAV